MVVQYRIETYEISYKVYVMSITKPSFVEVCEDGWKGSGTSGGERSG